MSRMAVLANRAPAAPTRALIAALAAAGDEVCVLHPDTCRAWPDPTRFVVALERLPERPAGRNDVAIERWLQATPCPSDPLPASSAARDKLAGGRLMVRAGLPVPRFFAVAEAQELPDPAALLGPPPWIAKPRHGARGEGVCLVDGIEAAGRVQTRLGVTYVLQRYVRDARCHRVLCSADECLAAYTKVDDRAVVVSVSHGARRVPLAADAPRVAALAMRMVAALGGHIMGADVLEDRHGGLWALDCNTVPGFDPDGDVPRRWARWVQATLVT